MLFSASDFSFAFYFTSEEVLDERFRIVTGNLKKHSKNNDSANIINY